MRKRPRVIDKFDPEFRFLLALDPALEGWRAWAAEYFGSLEKNDSLTRTALSQFLTRYVHGQELYFLLPSEFFATHC